jgi:hypothetical protein
MQADKLRLDGYYWVKTQYGWHVALRLHDGWRLSVGDPYAPYTDADFDEIGSRIRNPDEREETTA